MKTIFTLLASSLMSISVFATDTRPESELVIKSLDKNDIRVILDGRSFDPGYNAVMIQGLDAGYHKLEVYSDKNDDRCTNGNDELIYSSTVAVKPRTILSVTIDCEGNSSINEGKIQRRSFLGDDHSYDVSQGTELGSYDTHYGYTSSLSSMSDRQFNQVLQSISKEWLESNKLKSAIHIVTVNNLTVAQVKQLALLFSFETNKLELAKQAYASTVDKENYFMINDVFAFNGSKAELARYIRSL